MNTKTKPWIARYPFLYLMLAFALGAGLASQWPGSPAARAQSKLEDFILGGGAPRSFADLAAKVQSSVVNISTTKNLRTPRGPFYSFHEDYWGGADAVKRPNSLGSGFIVDKAGYILTNNHVVKDADEIQVTLSDGRTLAGEVIGSDPQSDIAVIKIQARGDLPVAALGDSEMLRIGDWVMAIGNPFGLGQTVTSGILSAKGRVIGAGPYDNFLQTDASINPGNSGGPLFNLKGEVVGVNTAIIAGGQGIGFAIPINMAKLLIPQLIKSGKVDHAYLGIGLQDLTPELAKSLGLSEPQGILIGAVYQGSPADQAGLKAGDVIVKYNGKAITTSHDLPVLVSQTAVGSQVELEALRNGKSQNFTVRLGSMEQSRSSGIASQKSARTLGLGLSVRDLTPQEQAQQREKNLGVVVTAVSPDSPAAAVGIAPGDIIWELNQQAIRNSREFTGLSDKLRPGQVVRLAIKRGPVLSYFAFSL